MYFFFILDYRELFSLVLFVNGMYGNIIKLFDVLCFRK